MNSLTQKIKKSLLSTGNITYLKANIWRVLFYLNLLVYGFYGALVSTDRSVFLLMTLIICMTQLSFGLIEKKQLPGSLIQVTVNSKIMGLFLLILLLASYKIVNNSLIGDELSYTQSALRHSLVLAGIVVEKVSFFDVVQFKYLVLAINLIIFIAVLAVVYFLNSISNFKRIAISIFLMIGFRGVIFMLGGNASPHPPLNHIFTFIVSSVLPLSNFSVRLSYLIAFTVFAGSIYYLISARWPGIQAFLITCSIISIPPLLHLGVTVETSLWTTCIFSYILVYLAVKDDIDYRILILLGSVFTVARIPSVIILLPVFLFYIRTVKLKSWHSIINHVWQWAPVILFLPFLIPSVIKGTAATDYSGSDVRIIEKYISALKSNVIWHSMLAVIPLFWIIFLPFSFLKKNKSYLHSAIYLLTFFILLAVFYSLKPNLWGGEKYQDEMFIPFIIVGFIQFLKVIELIKRNNMIVKTGLVIIIALNLFYFGRAGSVIENSNINKDYSYESAYTYINHINAQDSTLSVGLTYGILPEIINGYSSLNYKRALAIYKDFGLGLFSSNSADSYEGFATKINEDKRIKYIIIGLTADKEIFSKVMKNENWTIEKTFQGTVPSFNVQILKKQL